MKKFYSICAVVLVSTVAFAFEPGDGSRSTGLAVVKKNESTFNLFYQPAGITNVKVVIQDSHGKEIYSELVRKTDGFIRPYSFSNLDEGNYTLTVIDGENTFTEKLSYAKEVVRTASVIKLDASRYMVAIPASKNKGTSEIRVFNGNELAYTQRVKNTSDFGQVFNVKNLSNEVSFQITDSSGNKIN